MLKYLQSQQQGSEVSTLSISQPFLSAPVINNELKITKL